MIVTNFISEIIINNFFFCKKWMFFKLRTKIYSQLVQITASGGFSTIQIALG